MSNDFKLAIGIILVGAGTVALIPALIYWGTWLNTRPELCRDQVSNTGASGYVALECSTRGATITIERAGQSVVSMCRCRP